MGKKRQMIRRHVGIKGVLVALVVGVFDQLSMANSGVFYKSTGQHGEALFSQMPPIDRKFQTVPVYYLHPPLRTASDACRYLSINLQTLQSGGNIVEVDEQGRRRPMSAEAIQAKITDIQDAVREHCHD
ncbi:hypothetical protein AZ602_07300 [Moraxella sp. RCAD0137]|nr:hypothetical protein AZ602_07300 [Moraxella sp. RCAD0137]